MSSKFCCILLCRPADSPQMQSSIECSNAYFCVLSFCVSEPLCCAIFGEFQSASNEFSSVLVGWFNTLDLAKGMFHSCHCLYLCAFIPIPAYFLNYSWSFCCCCSCTCLLSWHIVQFISEIVSLVYCTWTLCSVNQFFPWLFFVATSCPQQCSKYLSCIS